MLATMLFVVAMATISVSSMLIHVRRKQSRRELFTCLRHVSTLRRGQVAILDSERCCKCTNK